MLRLFNLFGIRLSRAQGVSRCLTTEIQQNVEDFDQEKKKKVLELEISVSFKSIKLIQLLNWNKTSQILGTPTRRQKGAYV